MPPGVYWKRVKANAPYRDPEWLRRRYLEDLQSTRQIAIECEADTKTIAYWLRKFGIPIRSVSESQLGSLGNNWKGGISATTWRRVAFEAHGNRCQVCGKTGKLDVHHKDRNQKNNVPENLMVLCRPCHKDIHFAEDPLTHEKMRFSALGNTNAKRKVNQSAYPGSERHPETAEVGQDPAR